MEENLMQLKRVLTMVLCLSLFFVSGCKNQTDDVSSVTQPSEPSVSEEEVSKVEPEEIPTISFAINPLTGVKELDPAFEDKRPVAIMINNINLAQGVQCGLDAADIIYETEVENGITRLMAVYKDVSKVERIGTVRSARYAYIDLAMGHNAFYCHHGQDPTYAKKHLKDTDAYTIDSNNVGKRISNGLATEHTLYAFGNKLWNALESRGKSKINGTVTMWQDFAGEEEKLTLSGGIANTATVRFSGAATSTFTYDSFSGEYTRISNGNTLKDYLTGKTTTVKNVFILLTGISDYADGQHRNINLTSGSGYYVTNGTFVKINWSKGNASSSLKFTNTDGTPLKVSAGDSWVCIANKYTVTPTFQ